ncbi:glycosyl transferase family 1 [Shewanella algae]|uniref:glycosyltransferase family 4 protein n=1 Tax=Shewanella algae TaxID=38313 RepID=UPI001182ED38|nr:glycosyltransferase family 4 protein [Shewanella algae]TVL09945.1 glycosyl transferase family 1 [Shewanella algae]
MKLLYVVNAEWFFISHRLPIALEAIKQGYEVHLACGVTDVGKVNYLKSLGISVHDVNISRSGRSLLKEFYSLKELYDVVSLVSPDVIHCVTIKGVIYGGLVSRFKKVNKRIFSISGLGYVFIQGGILNFFLRTFVVNLYRMALKGRRIKVIFQNNDDKLIFVKSKIVSDVDCCHIRGSGVDLSKFTFSPIPSDKPVVMFLARLLKDKGLIEFLEAADIVAQRGFDANFVLVGDIDVGNPNSITMEELEAFKKKVNFQHWGYSASVQNIIPKSHIMVLPSYREGLPKSLIEAAACGRPVITTDVPGCRDAISPGVSGILVPVKDSHSLANAIIDMIGNRDLMENMGREGRLLAEESFDINHVVRIHMNLYKDGH